jgi:peptidyl-prolyl cis-trans isomerase C
MKSFGRFLFIVTLALVPLAYAQLPIGERPPDSTEPTPTPAAAKPTRRAGASTAAPSPTPAARPTIKSATGQPRANPPLRLGGTPTPPPPRPTLIKSPTPASRPRPRPLLLTPDAEPRPSLAPRATPAPAPAGGLSVRTDRDAGLTIRAGRKAPEPDSADSVLGRGRTVRIDMAARRSIATAPDAAAATSASTRRRSPTPGAPARIIAEEEVPGAAIVARVANEKLTRQEVDQQVALFTRKEKFAGTKEAKERMLRAYRRRIIGDWIDTKLLAVEGRSRNITVTSDEIVRYAQGTAHENRLLIPIPARVTALGLTEADFKEVVTDAILGDKLIRQSIRNVVSDKQIQECIRTSPLPTFLVNPKRRVQQIFYQFRADGGADDVNAMMSEMKKIRRRLVWFGGKFEDYKQDNPEKGLFLREFEVTFGEPTAPERQFIYQAVFATNPPSRKEAPTEYKLKLGEISDVIRSDYGLHIVKVVAEQPTRPMTFEECRVKVEDAFYEQVRTSLLRELRDKFAVDYDLYGLADETPQVGSKSQLRNVSQDISGTRNRQPAPPPRPTPEPALADSETTDTAPEVAPPPEPALLQPEK